MKLLTFHFLKSSVTIFFFYNELMTYFLTTYYVPWIRIRVPNRTRIRIPKPDPDPKKFENRIWIWIHTKAPDPDPNPCLYIRERKLNPSKKRDEYVE